MVLGVDLGTSGVRAILVSGEQRVVGRAVAPLAASRPAPGRREQDSHDGSAALAAIPGIGLSGQQHGAVLLAAADGVLRPRMLWNS